mgnify:FL=1
MEVREQAERKIARLHSRLQQLESQNHRLAADCQALQAALEDAQRRAAAAPASEVCSRA